MKRKKGFYEKVIKRPHDLFFSILALILLSPLFVIISIFVRIKLGSPIIFIQNRPGQNDKIFKMYKFRTMTNQKDQNGKMLPDALRLNNFGKWLRATSLDELPELLNIIRGEMAIVGPRPLLVEYLDYYSENQKRRHELRPGLTGYAQVNGRNAISWEEKFILDVEYVDNVSFIGDWKIILKTVKKMARKEGINSNKSVTMEPFRGSKVDN